MAKRRSDLKPDAVALFDLMSATAVDSQSPDVSGVLADCAAAVAVAFGKPGLTWVPLELSVVCLPFVRDPKRTQVRNVFLCERGTGEDAGARSCLLMKIDAVPAEWLRLIDFAKAIGAPVAPDPIGSLSVDFVHPLWSVPEPKGHAIKPKKGVKP